MSLLKALAGLFMLRPPQDCAAEVRQDIRKLRRASDLHYAEASNARRLLLDNIEGHNKSATSLSEMVEFMSKDKK